MLEDGGDTGSTFILAGPIKGRSHRLFLITAAGNFIEATQETPFLQIGENKYGKPIVDRKAQFDMSMDRTVRATMGSFDSTMRSNLSVGPPIVLIKTLSKISVSSGIRSSASTSPNFSACAANTVRKSSRLSTDCRVPIFPNYR